MFDVPVTRLCRIRSSSEADEEPFPLDPDGFLDLPSTGEAAEVVPGAIVAPEVAASGAALVLLGEPGIGKSTAFRQILGSLGEDLQTVEIDGSSITDAAFDAVLGHHLEALPHLPETESEAPGITGGPSLVLVIDQVDESPMLTRLAGSLERSARGRHTRDLRVLMACRTADFPSDLERVLASICGRCVLADLAPLSRQDAVGLCESVGVDGESLVEQAASVGAGALASVPLTLEMLIRTYANAGRLSGSANSLFLDGIRALADEHDSERISQTSLDQRVAVAGRVAALLLLSGRRTIWAGRQLDIGDQDLDSNLLVGGNEQVPSGSFEVTRAAVEDTLSSALFTGRGKERLAFRHASMGACLAAAYLAEKQLPRQQLEALFLVTGPDGRQTIPALVREVAAWLVSRSPHDMGWMAQADPESLIASSSIIDPPEMRELLVRALLLRAGEIELGSRPWNHARWRVAHPGLSQQLLKVFQAYESEPEDWDSHARVRVAVRLAKESRATEVVPALLRIASSSSWSAYVRARAWTAAMEIDEGESVAVGLRLFESLRESEVRAREDPHDELFATLLDLLFPPHLDVAAVLGSLKKPQSSNFFGGYQIFLSEFASRIPRDSLKAVLDWVAAQGAEALEGTPGARDGDVLAPIAAGGGLEDASRTATGTDSDGSSAPPSEYREQVPAPRDPDYLDETLVVGVVSRALTEPANEDLFEPMATALVSQQWLQKSPEFPPPLCLFDVDGQELDSSVAGRRELALAMVKAALPLKGSFDRGDAWTLIDSWEAPSPWSRRPFVSEGVEFRPRSTLLDGGDISWLYTRADEVSDEPALLQALVTLIDVVYAPTDLALQEYVHEHQEHPAWERLQSWFTAVPLTERPEWFRGRRERPAVVDRSKEIGDRVQDLLQRVPDDPSLFEDLIYVLQFEPTTGHSRPPGNDLRRLAGYDLVAGQETVLDEAAAAYLTTAPHDLSWLGTGSIPWGAIGGVIALRWACVRGLPEFNDGEVLARWADAPLAEFKDREADDDVTLYDQMVKGAPGALAEVVRQYATNSWEQGKQAISLWAIDLGAAPVLTETVFELLPLIAEHVLAAASRYEAISAPVVDGERAIVPPESARTEPTEEEAKAQQWLAQLLGDLRALTEGAVRGDVERAEAYARDLWRSEGARGDVLGPVVLAVLLAQRAGLWTEFLSTAPLGALGDMPLRFERLCLELGKVRHEATSFAHLTEHEMSLAYQLFQSVIRPADDNFPTEAHFVSAAEEAAELRDSFIRRLSERGTEAAVIELDRLVTAFPERLLLVSALRSARQLSAAQRWLPPAPSEVLALVALSSRRLVRSGHELLNLIEEVLRAVEVDLIGHCELLWDRLPKQHAGADEDRWMPKPEAALCAYIAHELKLRLHGRGLAVNREVLIRPTNDYGAGDRTDILIESTLTSRAATFQPRRIALVVEVKGSWNPDLMTAQETQLVGRYLPEANADAGLYVVGWFSVPGWTVTEDYRRVAASKLDEEETFDQLRGQADALTRETAGSVKPMLIHIDRALKNASLD